MTPWITHDPGPDHSARLRDEVAVVIIVFKENRFPTMAPLNNMSRYIGKKKSRLARHSTLLLDFACANAIRLILQRALTPLETVELSIGTETICAELKFRMSLDDNPVEQITMAEAFSVVLQSFVEAILGRPASEAQITYAHATPDYAQRYGDYLHAPFRFGSVSNSYRLPVQLASTPNASGDDASYRLTQQLCQQLLEQTPRSASSMADRVRTLLLLTPIESLTEDVVARRLYVSRRTLARRLAAEGTGYRQIREQFLHELARSYLLQANQTVDTVAASLGYHDASAFRKAFKRWTGMTPKDFRARSASAS